MGLFNFFRPKKPKFDTSLIRWRKPWNIISPDHAPLVEAELKREMCAGHVLFGRSVTAIGYRDDGGDGDILFYLGDKLPRFAVVHLTYRRETLTAWPHTLLYDSLDDWLQRRMIPDAAEFAL